MAVSNLIVANNWEDDLEPSMEYHLQQQQLQEQQQLQQYQQHQQHQQYQQHPVPKSEPQSISHIDPALLADFHSPQLNQLGMQPPQQTHATATSSPTGPQNTNSNSCSPVSPAGSSSAGSGYNYFPPYLNNRNSPFSHVGSYYNSPSPGFSGMPQFSGPFPAPPGGFQQHLGSASPRSVRSLSPFG
ncbi:MAG: hypothetical protein M1831_000108 [Alyxoria varia]|nr:MAG: hypothetical protein M1831_000108 [Alyxoria varia]